MLFDQIFSQYTSCVSGVADPGGGGGLGGFYPLPLIPSKKIHEIIILQKSPDAYKLAPLAIAFKQPPIQNTLRYPSVCGRDLFLL